VVVLGHTKCGAVKGACDGARMGNLTTLLSKLEPAVEGEVATTANRTSSNPQFVENVAEINVRRNVHEVLNRSEILREMVTEGQIGIIGAMYDVSTGVVEFYEDTKVLTEQPQLAAETL
jgi:carbonic anhydrase